MGGGYPWYERVYAGRKTAVVGEVVPPRLLDAVEGVGADSPHGSSGAFYLVSFDVYLFHSCHLLAITDIIVTPPVLITLP